MTIMLHTVEDGRGNILEQHEIEVPDPEPTVEDRLAAVEQIVVDPAGDAKSLAVKVEELQQLLVAKGVVDRAEAIAISIDSVAVEDTALVDSGGVKPKMP